jgi:acetyltransferase-like isoleucine patch superfamily enzyme
VREHLKTAARGAALMLVLPALFSYSIRRLILGPDRALAGSAQALALLPGLAGGYLRRAFLSRVLAACAPSATIEFGVLFSQAGARLDANVYVGPRCHLGLVHLERDVLLGAGVHVPSGGATHGTGGIDRPIREQEGSPVLVRIGEGSWVGSNAVILADVGRHCVIAAGAVVTRPLPDYVVAAGVPARVIKDRRGGHAARSVTSFAGLGTHG